MKTLLFCLLLPLMVLLLLCAGSGLQMHTSPAAQAVHKVLGATADMIEKKGKLCIAGEGVAMPGGNVKGFTLSFFTPAPYTKERLRELLMESAQELLSQINNSEELRPYLVKYPFTEKNIDVLIFNRGLDRRRVIDPQISVAEFTGGTFTFLTIESEDSLQYNNEYEESYEEAKAILEKDLIREDRF